jgi:diguanylate cyclase (GGDEF)-like protein
MSGNLIFVRISLGLVVLTCAILLGMDLVGLLPRAQSELSASRIQLCESLAFESASSAARKDFSSIRKMFDAVVRRNEDVRAIGLRGDAGRLFVATAEHALLWEPDSEEGSTLTHARIPLVREGERWGTIEVRFTDAAALGRLSTLWSYALIRILVFVSTVGFFAYLFYMKRVLRHLDPTTVIPPRVQATLDVMAEGVLLLDTAGRIVLTNSTFADQIGRPAETLVGVEAADLGWLVPKSLEPACNLPWQRALEDSEVHTGTPLSLKIGSDSYETFVVNGAPVGEESGTARGAIATFNSITALERKTEQLEQALAMLEKSRDESRLRNEELQVLATCDPLTGLSNRRAFMQKAEMEFEAAARDGQSLCCVMVDIDHFKRVNDAHGHSTGDEVICRVAQELATEWRDRETVCRFGGEEFCMVGNMDIESAVALADRLRRSIAAEGFAPVPVTASFGISSVTSGADSFYNLLDQADQALYASKEGGRNRVTRYDEIPGKS